MILNYYHNYILYQLEQFTNTNKTVGLFLKFSSSIFIKSIFHIKFIFFILFSYNFKTKIQSFIFYSLIIHYATYNFIKNVHINIIFQSKL